MQPETGETRPGSADLSGAGPAGSSYPFLCVHYERRPGLGEDAPPLLVSVSPTIGLCGVFDGLGGGGAEIVTTGEGPRSGAWLAARIVRDVVRSHTDLLSTSPDQGRLDTEEATSCREPPPTARPPDFTSAILAAIRGRLREEVAKTGAGRSRVKGSLKSVLPTTLAVAWFDTQAGQVTAAWAGDSRVYLLTPSRGLQQVTRDDLKSSADPLENLTEDSPMSNCICADTDFVIHERRVHFTGPGILFAASDGCFDYVPTPLHFELMLLSTLNEAQSWEDWRERLQAAVVAATADDATLAGYVLGWLDFHHCRAAYRVRYQRCQDLARDHDSVRAKVNSLKRQLEEANAQVSSSREKLWADYRASYEELFRQEGARDLSGDMATSVAANHEGVKP